MMVAIRSGTFLMGSNSTDLLIDDETPVHQVHIGYDFYVSRTPITRAEWKQFVRETRHRDPSNCLAGQGPDHPVVCVSFQDAVDYTRWLSAKSGHRYRLLSEAEYEYVNRAGSATRYFWGSSPDELPLYASNNHQGTTPVGSLKPNRFGLYDTTGNVWSWTLDCYHSTYDGAPEDGSPWGAGGACASGRAIRGGSWSDDVPALRSASRRAADTPDETIGFRVAMSGS